MVALLAVAVINLRPLLEVAQGGDRERAVLVEVLVERPLGLARAEVVEHVGERHERVRLHLVHLDPKVSARHHHTRPAKLCRREAAELGGVLADEVVVALDVALSVVDLREDVGALEEGELLGAPKDGHVAVVFGEDVVEGLEERCLRLLVLQHEHGQVVVLGRDVAVLRPRHLNPDVALLPHLHRHKAVPRDAHHLVLLANRYARVDAAVALGVVLHEDVGEFRPVFTVTDEKGSREGGEEHVEESEVGERVMRVSKYVPGGQAST